ncbi:MULTISPECIES: hypothetical protein [Paraburkholderia]|uniref:hypothetical protein n=1 Tax=Paraburkholderia TaxID=1822464 RepID=UPI002AB6B823|nr:MULTISPECIES: hypothetical protein [Paraburkholderia]
METIRFHGRVIPETMQVSIGFSPLIRWKAEEIGVEMEFVCRIEKSKIEVECRAVKWRPEHFAEVYRRALDICRAKVDLVAFKLGWGLTVIFDTYVVPAGETVPIIHTMHELDGICTAYSLDCHFDEVCAQVLQRPLLFMALRELISAISLPHVSPVECARAMDRLKHLIARPGSTDKSAWHQMREALHVEEAYLRFITDHSANPRHGQPGHTSGAVTTEVTRRAWVVMNRYLEYLRRGALELDPIAFPLIAS